MNQDIVQAAAIVSAVLFAGLIIFQILLVAGLPVGEYAWRGEHRILPSKLRIASAFAVVILLLAAIIFLLKAEVLSWDVNSNVVSIASWLFTAYFLLNILGNLTSPSKKEKMLMGPVSLVVFVSCLVVTIWG